jgi:general secretion pathway protein B
MSYILDALKKAERERDISHIPTLTTVHDMPDTQSRKRYWIILGACFVCAALLVGIGLLLLKPVPAPAVSTTGIRSAAEEASATPVPPPMTQNAPGQVFLRETPDPKNQPSTPSDRGYAPEGRRAFPLRQFPKDPESPPPAAREFMRPPLPSRGLPPEGAAAIPTPVTQPAKPLSLREALAKMNMTILFYSENKSERMVFISDRKYAEGEYVDGLYLLESIIPEGAWLSYQGDRAILRTKPK